MSEAQRLQVFLLQEWSQGMRLTTIPQAIQRLGIADERGLRWRVAKGLEALWRDALTRPERRRAIAQALGRPFDESQLEGFRQQVGTWNLASIFLTENEKLMARYILMHKESESPPSPANLAGALGVPEPEIHMGLRSLARLGFIVLSGPSRLGRYTLAHDYEKFLKGLGFFFHTVTLDVREQFGVP